MLRSFFVALAMGAMLAVSASAFAQNASMPTASNGATVNASSAADGLHSAGTGGRAYPGGQKTN
jgi:hypothetical protein